jgi:hypothetical protein
MKLASGKKKQNVLCNIGQFIVVQSFNIILFHESLDVLFDIRDFGREAGFDLLDDFLDQLHVLHLFTRLHDTDDGGLGNVSIVFF